MSRSYRPHSLQLLIARGADLTFRARVPGHHERPGEVLDVSVAELLRDLPATLAMDRRQKLLGLIAERRNQGTRYFRGLVMIVAKVYPPPQVNGLHSANAPFGLGRELSMSLGNVTRVSMGFTSQDLLKKKYEI